MNRRELVDSVARGSDLSAAQVETVLQGLVDGVVAAVASGDRVAIAGFGTFEPRARAARAGRNPQTGEAMEIPASTAPAFKPAAAFKQAVARAEA